MSIARHHNEWLSLLEVSGPFLSMPVLMRVFPQGLEALEQGMLAELRQVYDEWLDDQNSLKPTTAIHSLWVRYVLGNVLGFEKSKLLEGPAIPTSLNTFVAEQAETLRPDLVIAETAGVRVIIQIHPITQGLEKSMQGRHWKASPAMRMLELLRATGVQLGLVTNGEQWMLVNAPRGETSAFVSWYAALWLEEPLTLRAFCSLLGTRRFFSVAEEDTLEGMLKASVNEQQEVTDQLGYQVRRAVEVLTRAVDKADQDRGRTLLKNLGESELYEAALTVMMRLVFLFSAEERGLLMLGDPLYDQNYAISTLRAQLRETADKQTEDILERRYDAWCRLLATFRAVHDGIHHDQLNLPAYGGSLFDPDRFPFLEGRTQPDLTPAPSPEGRGEIEPLPISNRTVLHLLEALQILRVKVPGGGSAEPRRLSFRSLDVEQIGHVYEGLLDHQAVRASEPVLGLTGTREKEPEIPLSILQAEEAKGEKSFLSFLKQQTGRSENALRKDWKKEADVFASQHLQIACNNDPQVFAQVGKYACLIRDDDFGYPAVFLAGSVYITAGATRRATGTHYTPRSLTEPIVQHTLEPLVYIGPAEGHPKEEWKLLTPAELLELKICDMAMGSAGFLVQVIRYLSERLVEAWERVEQGIRERGKGMETPGAFALSPLVQITPEGNLSTGAPGETLIPRDDEERLILARRLVADRCIYGVDKNPLAVEIARLSIWLTTMDKGRPFTFLDHALKCGDSLVGASEQDFLNWAHLDKRPVGALMDADLKDWLEAARGKRRVLEGFVVNNIRDAEQKAALLAEADQAMQKVKRGADLWAGAHLLGLKSQELEKLLLRLVTLFLNGALDGKIDATRHPDASQALRVARIEHVFHWEFEFPEVFERGGFSGIVGNPPFLGGKRISIAYGDNYNTYIKQSFSSSKGASDICAYFYRKANDLIAPRAYVGLLATNTISQADTREVGLDILLKEGVTVYRATNKIVWPGTAGVFVSLVHWTKEKWVATCYLDDNTCKTINSRLGSDDSINAIVHRITTFAEKTSAGTGLLGIGFVIDAKTAQEWIESDRSNQNILFPFINSEELSQMWEWIPIRYVINFGDRTEEECAQYSLAFQRVHKLVKPQREVLTRQIHEPCYWKHWDKREELYTSIENLTRVLVCPFVTKHLPFVFLPRGWIYSKQMSVFPTDRSDHFALLQSNFHNYWARLQSSTLTDRLSYSISDAYRTFPTPTDKILNYLTSIGESYHELRRQIMFTRQEGLTTTYNRFHNPKEKASDIARLRELHMEMDNAVATAYGWSDLDLGHGFHETAQGLRYTISEESRREVLRRLLELNHERYEEEVRAGLHEKKGKGKGTGGKGKRGKAVKEKKGQYELF